MKIDIGSFVLGILTLVLAIVLFFSFLACTSEILAIICLGGSFVLAIISFISILNLT